MRREGNARISIQRARWKRATLSRKQPRRSLHTTVTAVIDSTCYLYSSFIRPWLSRPVSIRRPSNYSSIAFTYHPSIPDSLDVATIFTLMPRLHVSVGALLRVRAKALELFFIEDGARFFILEERKRRLKSVVQEIRFVEEDYVAQSTNTECQILIYI